MRSQVNYGIDFLHQKTPVFVGYDRIASRMNVAFVYCEMEKIARGKYRATYHEILPDAEKFASLEVVKKFHHLLENTINRNPDNWLWSHKRWKYQDAIKQFEQN
jgi:KDO2-lipid IV(A) lauroyltransferase